MTGPQRCHLARKLKCDLDKAKQPFKTHQARRDFVLDTVGKLNGLDLYVLSVEYVPSGGVITFQCGHLAIKMPINCAKTAREAATQRDFVVDCIIQFNEQGLNVRSFTYCQGNALEFKNGHLSLVPID